MDWERTDTRSVPTNDRTLLRDHRAGWRVRRNVAPEAIERLRAKPFRAEFAERLLVVAVKHREGVQHVGAMIAAQAIAVAQIMSRPS